MKVILNKKCLIQIPNDVILVYIKQKRKLFLKSLFYKKFVKLNLQVFVNYSKRFITVSQNFFYNLSKNKMKIIKSLQGLYLSMLRQIFIEVSFLIYRKLNLMGVGYRVFFVKNFENKLLLFRLGYSHFLYFKIIKNINCFCYGATKLFICGFDFKNITQWVFNIRSYKKPEPYKGKGIVLNIEKTTLKKRKKI